MSTTYQTNLDNTNHVISISLANNLIGRFVDYKDSIIAGDFDDADPFTLSQTFNKAQVIELLNQTGCIGLRSYFGLYDDNTETDRIGRIVLVLCGVDENGNDLNLDFNHGDEGQMILENSQLCPPHCGASSQINNL